MWVPTAGRARFGSSGSATRRTSPAWHYPFWRSPNWWMMRSRDVEVWVKSISPAPFLAIKWISQLPLIRCLFRRKYSRIRRLILFLCAAFPTFRVTVIPRRQCGRWFCWTMARKCGLSNFLPFRRRAINCDRFKILSALVNSNLLKDAFTWDGLGG